MSGKEGTMNLPHGYSPYTARNRLLSDVFGMKYTIAVAAAVAAVAAPAYFCSHDKPNQSTQQSITKDATSLPSQCSATTMYNLAPEASKIKGSSLASVSGTRALTGSNLRLHYAVWVAILD
ncbi:hypothetical protein WG66_014537 [Moniliophthora roreri]|nr:hypothetical protein WG66_014537 [Moniliophthora roreri]